MKYLWFLYFLGNANTFFFLVQNILGEFNKEQEAFAKTQGNAGNAVSPWVGHANEERIKEEILSLSAVSKFYFFFNK